MNYIDSPAAQAFKKAQKYFVDKVAQPIANQFATWTAPRDREGVISVLAKTKPSIDNLMKTIHQEIPKAIALLQSI